MAFKLETLYFRECSIESALGTPVQLPAYDPNASFDHWADMQKARQWFRYAKTLLDQVVGMDARPFEEQKAFLSSIGTAIMNGYNALNIPWATDPDARRLYRQYLAGRPDTDNQSTREYDFGDRVNYGGAGWFQPSRKFPRDSSGSIIQSTKQLFLRYYPRPDRAAMHPLEYNLAFVPSVIAVQRRGEVIPGPGIFDDAEVRAQTLLVTSRDWANAWTWVTSELGRAQCVDIRYPPGDPRTPCSASAPPGASLGWQPSWFAFEFDVSLDAFEDRTPLIVRPPLVYFYPWLKEWAESVAGRTPQQIIICARRYVIWRNSEQLASLGGSQASFFSQASGTQTDLETQLNRPSQGANIAAATVAAVGAAFSGITFGISALVGGATAAAITVANSAGAFHGDVSGHGRNDIGWYKPLFERAWLSGDPSARQPDGSQDVQGEPGQIVPDVPPQLQPESIAQAPQSWDAANATAPQFFNAISGYGSGSPGRQIGAPAAPSPVVTVAAIAIGAGLLYAGYRFLAK